MRYGVVVADERFQAYGTEPLGFDQRFKVHGTESWDLLSNLGLRHGRNYQDDDSCSFGSYRKPEMFRMRLTVRKLWPCMGGLRLRVRSFEF